MSETNKQTKRDILGGTLCYDETLWFESTPERRMIAALIMRSIVDYVKVKSSNHKIKADAWWWLFEGTDGKSPLCGERPFSFLWCCNHISQDGTGLRDKILACLAPDRAHLLPKLLSFRLNVK